MIIVVLINLKKLMKVNIIIIMSYFLNFISSLTNIFVYNL